MIRPPLRARTFGSNAESELSGISAFKHFAGKIPAMHECAGWVGNVGDNTYRLERTIPAA